jgi:hypothetical protein
MEEESAGSSCEAENKIFDGKMGVDVLLIKFKAWFWEFGENWENAEANCMRFEL